MVGHRIVWALIILLLILINSARKQCSSCLTYAPPICSHNVRLCSILLDSAPNCGHVNFRPLYSSSLRTMSPLLDPRPSLLNRDRLIPRQPTFYPTLIIILRINPTFQLRSPQLIIFLLFLFLFLNKNHFYSLFSFNSSPIRNDQDAGCMRCHHGKTLSEQPEEGGLRQHTLLQQTWCASENSSKCLQ
jgi:hypothetical protein